MERSNENYDALIDALFEGEATAEEAARLLGETGGEEIEELAELVETLARIDPDFDGPSDDDFRRARAAVLDRIERSERRGAATAMPRWLPLAAALAAFAVGLAVGQGSLGFGGGDTVAGDTGPGPTDPSSPAGQELGFAAFLDREVRQASRNGGAPLRFANLDIRELDDDRLAVTVDVAAQLDLVRSKDDPLLNEILADALVSDPSLGARLEAVRHVGSSPHVRRALITAALEDPDVSVRLKALTRLVEQDPASPETQQTLLTVLAEEESVAMRLLAVDSLQDSYLDRELLDRLDADPTDDGESAVLWRAQQRLARRDL